MMHEANKLHQLALNAYSAGKAVDALEWIEKAIAAAPDIASFHADWAVIAKGLRPDSERAAHYLRAIELEPGNPVFHANLAATLNACGKHADAEMSARRAIQLMPQRPESWHNLATSQSGQQQWQEALNSYERAIELGIKNIQTRLAAGRVAIAVKAHATVITHFSAVLEFESVSNAIKLDCLIQIGKANEALDAWQAAIGAYQAALKVDQDCAEVLVLLGNLFKRIGWMDDARMCYRRVLERTPDCAEAEFNLGAVEHASGNYKAALQHYRNAISINPALPALWSNLTACMIYSAEVDPNEIPQVLQAFDRTIAKPLRGNTSYSGSTDPKRRLKVAYVSADFRAHPVGYLALPLIEGHSRDQFHVTAYFSHHKPDEWTSRFRAASDAWVDAAGMDDAHLAEKIRSDKIDILVDLAGHTEGNRLLAFARKPAPVQATWMGYVTTTGMDAIDWRLTHIDADPPEFDKHYSERLWRLPGTMWCFRPLPNMAEVGSSPFLKNGYVTFGTFNRFSKNSSQALAAWAEILRRVPGSKLIVCGTPEKMADGLGRFFSEHRVSKDRIQTVGSVGHERFWALHSEVDIALDPFPFNGGMTSCETLWLGVPLVTCTGSTNISAGGGAEFKSRFASRMGFAFLNNIGLRELSATTIPHYIETAVALASNPSGLSRLRGELRSRMRASPLMDEKRFVHEVESAYRQMWHQYCEKNT